MLVEMADRNMVSWNSLVADYVRRRDVDKALRIFYEMPEMCYLMANHECRMSTKWDICLGYLVKDPVFARITHPLKGEKKEGSIKTKIPLLFTKAPLLFLLFYGILGFYFSI